MKNYYIIHQQIGQPKMDKFLKTYKLPRVNHEEIENLNRPITSKESESVVQTLPTVMWSRTTWLHWWIPPNSQRRINTSPSQTLPKIDEEGTLPNSFYEASITRIPKPDKDVTKKENYRPISLMNIDAKILNRILANRIHQHIKRILHPD